MHDDLVAVARMCNNREAENLLRAAKRNFLRGITLTILIQTIGRPGWVKNASIEFLRNLRLSLVPYVFERLFQDGWKLLSVR